MSRLVILVEFRIKPEHRAEFATLIRDNAKASLRLEPGCRQFDVLLPDDEPGDRIVLYEVYDGEDAFAAHLKTEHFRQFDTATADMVEGRSISRLRFAED